MQTITYDISNSTINYILISLGIILGSLGFYEEIGRVKGLERIKIFGVRFTIFALTTLAMGWFNNLKDNNNEIRNSNEAKTKDATNLKKYNSSLNIALTSTNNAIGNTLAKYKLKYDSATHEIKSMIADSSLRRPIVNQITNNNISEVAPEFEISDIRFKKLRNDSLDFEYDMISKKGVMKNLNLKLNIILLKENNPDFIPQTEAFIPTNITLPSDHKFRAYSTTFTPKKGIFKAFFHIFGSYDYKGKKEPIDLIYEWNFKTALWGIPGNLEEVAAYFKSKIV